MDSVIGRVIGACVVIALGLLLVFYSKYIISRNTARIAPLLKEAKMIEFVVQQRGPLGLVGRPAVEAPNAGFQVTGPFNGSVAMAAGVTAGDIIHTIDSGGRAQEVVAWPTQSIVQLMGEELSRPLRLIVMRSQNSESAATKPAV